MDGTAHREEAARPSDSHPCFRRPELRSVHPVVQRPQVGSQGGLPACLVSQAQPMFVTVVSCAQDPELSS